MTAREIIEARLGHPMPPTRDLAPDEREAVARLAKELCRARIEQMKERAA